MVAVKIETPLPWGGSNINIYYKSFHLSPIIKNLKQIKTVQKVEKINLANPYIQSLLMNRRLKP